MTLALRAAASFPFRVLAILLLATGLPAHRTWSQEPAPEQPAELLAVQAGDLPIVISAPHGGSLPLPGAEPRTGEGIARGPSGFVASRDTGTEELALLIAQEIARRFDRKPYFVVSRVHRKYVDFNRPARIGAERPPSERVHAEYHQHLSEACQKIAQRFRGGILLDVHGQSTQADTVFRGTKNGKAVTLLTQRFGDAALFGPESLFGLLAARDWNVFPTQPGEKEKSGFTGGYIVQTYGNAERFAIDAYQLEFGGDYRRRSHRQKTAETLADALVAYARLYLNLKETAAAK